MSKPTDAEMAENSLICEKLLGWKREEHGNHVWWNPPSINGAFAASKFGIPAFTTWSEAGLILDAFQLMFSDNAFDLAAWNQLTDIGQALALAKLSPSKIRNAALEYIRRTQ